MQTGRSTKESISLFQLTKIKEEHNMLVQTTFIKKSLKSILKCIQLNLKSKNRLQNVVGLILDMAPINESPKYKKHPTIWDLRHFNTNHINSRNIFC